VKKLALIFALASAIPGFVVAATVPGVFNTGVDAEGKLIDASDTIDPHYQLTESPDEISPGPDAVTLNPGFPVGPWLPEGPDSRWIAPRAEQNIGSAEGDFTYRTTFSLTGFDPTTAVIVGRWATDNSGLDILLNGESLFISSVGFDSWADFEISEGFVDGENTLDFVLNNAPATNNPTGLRVELGATADLLDVAPPVIAVQPVDQSGLVGDNVSLNLKVTGSPPLTFTWTRDDETVATLDTDTFDIPNIQLDQAGNYRVTVANEIGSADSDVAVVSVKQSIPGLFGTGVDDNGTVLEDLAPDPHYRLTMNPDSETTEPVVHDSQIFPIVEGPYTANTDTSKWIAPLGDTAAAAGGEYHYTITFDLTGLDPKTAFLTGLWASDNAGVDTLLNGASLGIGNQGGFGMLSRFTIEDAPFVSGENFLTFIINNAGTGFTAFRIDDLRGGADLSTGGEDQAPTLLLQPESAQVLVGETLTLRTLADGNGELTYTWQRGDITVGTGAELILNDIQPPQEGTYQVMVTNAQGSITSEGAIVSVLESIPGLFSTGVDDEGNALEDLTADRHYTLVLDPEDPSPDVIVLDSNLFPIVDGPWLANEPTSKWIGVQEDNNGPAGDYGYELTFDLSAFDPDAVFVEGSWATDNSGIDILLNGESTGTRSDGQFTSSTDFRFETGFVSGLNTLEFQFNNAGDDINPTGLLVRGLRGGGQTEDPNLIAPNQTPFGQLESTNAQTLMIALRNSGRTEVLTVSNTSITGPASGLFTLGEVPADLQPNETVMVALSFDPQGQTGNFSAALEITSNDPTSPIHSVDISAFIPVAPGLLAHYKFDESAGNQLVDSSGFGRNGNLVATSGTLTLNEDPLATGRALGLMGGAFVEISSNVLPSLTDFSISLWVNAADSVGAVSLISRGDGAGDPFALLANGSSLLWFSAGDQALVAENALTLNQTHHVLAVVKGNEITLYVDGGSVGQASIVAFSDDDKNSLQIGAANGILGFNGRLDDLQIYERPLNANQANFLATNPGQVVGANPGGGGGNTQTPEGFIITEVRVGAGRNIRVNFVSEPNKNYVAEFSSDLINWTVTVDDIASEAPLTIVRQALPEPPTGFIRIREKD
jgi:hypothetical protein